MNGLAPGASVGPYRITRLLGRGGMGAVYEAVSDTGERVAIKVLLDATDPDFLERFRREARAAAKVSHRNVARVLGSGEVQGVPYLVLEYLGGGSLADRLKKTGRVPWLESARLGAAIARGLSAIHEARLVHRDLKPANVLLDAEGAPRVADFGLARTVGRGSIQLTKTGEMLGTYEFMAPEQAEGGSAVDERADLYALGGTLFALLTGEPPFEGSGFSLLTKLLREKPRSVSSLTPQVPVRLERLVARLLEKLPQERGTDAEAIAELDAIAASAGTARGRALAVGLGLAAIGLAVAGAFLALGSRPGPGPAASPTPTTLARTTPDPTPLPTPLKAPEVSRVQESDLDRIEGKTDDQLAFAGLRLTRGALKPSKTRMGASGVGHRHGSLDAVFLSESRALSCGFDGRLIVWDLASGRVLDDQRASEFPIAKVAASQDGKDAVSADMGGGLVHWTFTSEGKLARQRRLTPDHVASALTAALFLGATRIVVAGSATAGLHRYDLEHGGTDTLLSKDPVEALGPGNFTDFFVAHDDGRIDVRHESGEVFHKIPPGPDRVSAIDRCEGMLLVTDSFTRVGHENARKLSLFSLADLDKGAREIALEDVALDAVVADAEGRHVVASSSSGVLLSIPAKGEPRSSASDPETAKHRGTINSIAASPDRMKLLTTGWDHTVRLWSAGHPPRLDKTLGSADRVTGLSCVVRGEEEWLGVSSHGPSLERTLVRIGLRDGDAVESPRSCPRPALSVAVSPTRGWIAAGFDDTLSRVFEPNGAIAEPFCQTASGGWVRAVEFLRDGVRYASVADDGNLRLCDPGVPGDKLSRDAPPPSYLRACTAPGAHPACVVAGLAGKRSPGDRGREDSIVTCATDGSLWWWEATSNKFIKKTQREARGACALAIDGLAPGTDEVLVGFEDGALEHRTREGESSRVVRRIPAHARARAAAVTSLAWHGDLVLSASADGTVSLWRWTVGSAAECGRIDFTGQDDRPTAVVFHPRGDFFYVGTERGAVLQFEIVDAPAKK